MRPAKLCSNDDARALHVALQPGAESKGYPDACELPNAPDNATAREHNAALPIHALPGEVLLDILFASIEFTTMSPHKPLIPQLHLLAQVCTYWLHSIRSNYRFWCLINFDEREWVETVLKKNPDGPLTVRCLSYNSPVNLVTEFLHFARHHAHRWETVIFDGKIGLESVQLLEVDAPLLRYLHLRDPDNKGVFDVQISAPALQHVLFEGLHLQLNAPSLSGLKYLMICHLTSAFPSLVQLINLLHSSPGLEWFGLEELYEDDRDMGTRASDLGGPVHLPALQGLLLQLINHNFISAWIDAPNCRLFSGFIPFNVLTWPGSTAIKLAKIPIQTSHAIETRYLQGANRGIDICSSERYESELCCTWWEDRFQSVVITHVPEGVEHWRLVMEILGIPVEGRTDSLKLDLRYEPNAFSSDQIGIWSSASCIVFTPGYPHVLRALQFLADPKVVDGMVSWNFPKVTSIEFAFNTVPRPKYWSPGVSYDALADAVLDLLWQRSVTSLDVGGSFGGNGEWPVPLKVVAVFAELLERLEGKIPEGTKIQLRY